MGNAFSYLHHSHGHGSYLLRSLYSLALLTHMLTQCDDRVTTV
jgi:hypothetical protein